MRLLHSGFVLRVLHEPLAVLGGHVGLQPAHLALEVVYRLLVPVRRHLELLRAHLPQLRDLLLVVPLLLIEPVVEVPLRFLEVPDLRKKTLLV